MNIYIYSELQLANSELFSILSRLLIISYILHKSTLGFEFELWFNNGLEK